MRAPRLGWLLRRVTRGAVLGDAPDRAHLGRGDLPLMLGASVGLDVGDDFRSGAAGRPATPAGHLHQHGSQPWSGAGGGC